MMFFEYLSIILGGGMVVGGFLAAFWPGIWKNLIPRVMPEKRPQYVLWINVVWTALVLGTWAMFFMEMSSEGFVVTFVMTLTLLKVAGGAFFWKKYREMILALMVEPLAMKAVMLSTAAIGLALMTMGIFF
ncbi:MAG: hypothetical protein BWY42_00231 [Candidatus Omnitrophica bacterium ADurb.Bin277]|nr:MAG: hypothetical protein BWY42_00231 [Candidatus Omnitrophica bacterium ADurb.Bin277]